MRKLKESGIEWIGRIPQCWEVKPIGSCFKERNEKVSDYDWEPLSVTKQGIVKQLEKAAKSNAHDARKKVCINDFVINSRSDRKQSCGISIYDGSVSLINIVLTPLKIEPCYCNYLLKNYGFAEEFYRFGSGIVADLWSTNYSKMKKIYIPMPPIEEQRKIACFLDKKVLEIDNAIKKTKETIEDYKKLKVAVITKATSKGLNLKCKMKTSNINLIGKIPKHWELKKVKYVVDSIAKGNGITKEEVVANGDTPCIRYGEIYTKYNYFFENCITRTNKDMISSKRYISRGDLLFAGTGELVEEIGKNIAYLGNDECLAGGDIVVIKHHQEPLFLTFALNSAFGQGQKSFGKAKLKVVHISGTEIGNVVIPVPPIEEQKEIGLFLKEKCNEIDNLIENKEKIVEELEQYKKSVIYEYVTGKKEVK